jgi:Fic family protein
LGDRKSEAEIPPLISDPVALAEREARNALDQFDWAISEVDRWIKSGDPSLRVSTLLKLHRLAMDGIDQYAGNFRPASVAIKGSRHVPVAGEDVPRNVEEMLDYLSANWKERTAIHLSSYVMWRLNWIHPFADGNGRTSRILSYMVLSARLGQILPGTRTIPEQISEQKQPYYDALELADVEYKKGRVDVGAMEKLLEGYLANQLLTIHEKATGNGPGSPNGATTPVRATQRHPIVAEVESKPVIYGGLLAVILAIAAAIFG